MQTGLRKILSFFSIFLLACALSACGSDTPEKVAEKYVAAVYKGDVDTMVKLVYIPPEKQDAGTEDMLRGKLQMMVGEAKKKAERLGGVTKITAGPARYANGSPFFATETFSDPSQLSGDDIQAGLLVTVVFKEGEPQQKHVTLIKVKDTWKIKI